MISKRQKSHVRVAQHNHTLRENISLLFKSRRVKSLDTSPDQLRNEEVKLLEDATGVTSIVSVDDAKPLVYSL